MLSQEQGYYYLRYLSVLYRSSESEPGAVPDAGLMAEEEEEG